jgi:hypothetical protein
MLIVKDSDKIDSDDDFKTEERTTKKKTYIYIADYESRRTRFNILKKRALAKLNQLSQETRYYNVLYIN